MIVIWFRKDLRIEDNPALSAALEAAKIQGLDSNQIHAIYIASPEQWQIHNGSAIQADFIERHLNLLSSQLASYGITLQLLIANQFADTTNTLNQFCQQNHIQPNQLHLFANQELEFNERQRDQQLLEQGFNLNLYEADVIISKGTVVNKQNAMFKVFTPFKRQWLQQFRQQGFQFALINPPEQQLSLRERSFIQLPLEKKDSSHWPLVTQFSEQNLSLFIEQSIADYQQQRDFPALEGTSRLSPYLAIGALSPKTVMMRLLEQHPEIVDSDIHPVFSWLNELIWREFYRHLMHCFPKLSKSQDFRPEYRHLPWVNNDSAYQAWCQGKTGYPLVDAAMRQLIETGWMHNRLRMVVASFLTKHLLVDWRLGEQFFSQHLIDNDLAANNGGWQWAAGTGCDAQPYFRIFNPISQSQKFDPQGTFIRKFIAELGNINDKDIHFPYQSKAMHQCDYWPPIVDHKTAREQALDFYNQNKGNTQSQQPKQQRLAL